MAVFPCCAKSGVRNRKKCIRMRITVLGGGGGGGGVNRRFYGRKLHFMARSNRLDKMKFLTIKPTINLSNLQF